MIVVNRNWLVDIGMPRDVVDALEETSGLMLSSMFVYASGFHGGRYTRWLLAEPAPRTLWLVGMSDRYDNAQPHAASIIDSCTSGPHHRAPSEAERTTLLRLFDAIDHPTAQAIAVAIRKAPLLPTRRYKLRIIEHAGHQPLICDVNARDLASAVAEADARAADGFIGGRVEVVDTTIGHPDHNVVHVAERRH